MSAIDDDIFIESVSNSPKPVLKNDTPMSSNPGTPRSEMESNHVNKPAVQPEPAQIQQPPTKYGNLLAVIEDLGKDIRPTYAGNRTSAERLKRGIVHARILVRECLMECERNART